MRRSTLWLSSGVLLTTACGPQQAYTPTAIERAPLAEEGGTVLDLPQLDEPQQCAGYVAVTFDDGPTDLTDELLAVLHFYDIPAAFFNMGIQEDAFPRQVQLIEKAGHQLGNHTQTHADLLDLSAEEVGAEIDRANMTHTHLGHERSDMFRPPYGSTSPGIRELAEERGMTEVLWSVDSKDYEATSTDAVVEKSSGGVDGDIILFHDGRPQTIEAMPGVIQHYWERGLCFGAVTLTDEEMPTDVGTTHRAKAVSE